MVEERQFMVEERQFMVEERQFMVAFCLSLVSVPLCSNELNKAPITALNCPTSTLGRANVSCYPQHALRRHWSTVTQCHCAIPQYQ